MDLKPTTIILLIDFEGHPILGDDFTNNQRFSTLAWLLNAIREKPLVIVSDHIPGQHRKTEEVAKITRIEKRNIWLTIDPRECSIERIVDEVHRKGYNLKNVHYNYIPTYTAVGHTSIYTGTTPVNHGIISNNWYDKYEKKSIYCDWVFIFITNFYNSIFYT